MAYATGVAKQVAIVKEVTEGVSPVTGSKLLRRVSSDLALDKDSYQSEEILVSMQLRDARHGTRRPAGTFTGQLSPGSFNDFWEGIFRDTFANGSVVATVDLVLAVSAGTLTLSGGGLTAGGLRKEDVVVITGAGSPNTGINGKRLRLNSLTNTVATTRDLPSGLTDGTLTGVTVTVVGKKIFMPASGQDLNSYSIEHWFSDVAQSELFVGCKFGQTSIEIPATGLVRFSTQIQAMNMLPDTSRQLTSPAAQNATSALAAVNGKMSYNNVDQAVVTGMTLNLASQLEAPAVLGSDFVPHIFQGNFAVTGSFTALFTDQTIANTFVNETEVSVSLWMLAGAANSSDFMRLTMPRLKLMRNRKSDGTMSLVQTFNFTALENVTDTAADLTTIVLQDSAA